MQQLTGGKSLLDFRHVWETLKKIVEEAIIFLSLDLKGRRIWHHAINFHEN